MPKMIQSTHLQWSTLCNITHSSYDEIRDIQSAFEFSDLHCCLPNVGSLCFFIRFRSPSSWRRSEASSISKERQRQNIIRRAEQRNDAKQRDCDDAFVTMAPKTVPIFNRHISSYSHTWIRSTITRNVRYFHPEWRIVCQRLQHLFIN